MIEIARSAGARVVIVNPAANERNMSPFKSQHKGDLSSGDLARWKELVAQATTQQKSGELEQALNALDQAIEIDPLFAETISNGVRFLFALRPVSGSETGLSACY